MPTPRQLMIEHRALAGISLTGVLLDLVGGLYHWTVLFNVQIR